jgi:hypothetical protein
LGAEVSAIRHLGVGAFLASLLSCAAATALADGRCNFTVIGSGAVRTTSDGGLVLEDGRIVRLAGLDLPRPAEVAVGTGVTLKRLGTASQSDRYNHVLAHVFITENGAERWLQADLVRQGLARVARVGDTACARVLLAEEQSARAAKLGLWADPYYVMNKAEDPGGILKSRGRLALVEGQVLSVRESGGTIYVNFGRRWSEDFTVTIAKRNERAFTAAGLEPKQLSGKRVRVRGWIEERGGPWVDAARPEQIEVLN